MQLISRLHHAVAIVAVDDEDDGIGVQEIVAPERPDLVLATHVPHGEVDVLVLDRLDVESDGRDRRDVFAELELVQDGRLARRVQPDHEDSDFSLRDEALEDAAEVAHLRPG
mmetsp:Transcript_40866/g.97847  ORF Transcript_40866/g.97847 Transcript_40866/m.97847 type:complete len:112 (+) Transcript_40866:1-336(+)